DRPLSDNAVLRGVDRELATVERQRASSGWRPELTARTLAALRVAANYLLGYPVTQRVAGREADRSAIAFAGGALAVRGAFGRAPIVASGAATPLDVEEELARTSRDDRRGAARALRLEELQQALATFNNAQYGRNEELHETALDEALSAGRRVVRQLRRD